MAKREKDFAQDVLDCLIFHAMGITHTGIKPYIKSARKKLDQFMDLKHMD